jgi:UDP-glucose 4-epimerase
MSILVTGGAGYIGSHVALSLLDAGEKIVVLDNCSTGFRALVPARAEFVDGNVGDPELVEGVLRNFKIKSVIHLAASVVVPESVADPLSYYLNNTVRTRTLIEACVKTGVQNFVFSSTAAVYGNPKKIPVAEDAELMPMSPYGASKMMSERILQDASAAHGMNYMILRYFNVAGADPKTRAGQSTKNATHLIKVAVETACGKRPSMRIFGTSFDTPDGTCIRDYIHVADLADFHLAALTHLQSGGGNRILNCGYGRGFSVREVIKAVEKVSGKKLKIEEAPPRAGDPARIVADCTAMKKQLKVVPRFDNLETIVEHALAWEKSL